MTSVRDELLGVSLAGRYRLEEWLGGDDNAAFFLTSSNAGGLAASESPGGRRAVLKLIPEDPSTSAETLALWRKTAALSHPNLLPLLDCGRGDAAGRAFLYSLFEFPDESLSSALEQRPLAEAESREVWNAVVEALRYIHSQGLVHGAVDPDHIVAVGDRIKLASDALREPGPGFEPADDFRALGKMGLQGGQVAPLVAPPAPRRSIPVWLYPAVAALLMISILAIRRSSRTDAITPVPPPAAAAPAPRATVAPAASAPARPRPAWRVIAYTYNSFRGADKKARRVNEQHPGMRAEVFAPKGKNRPPYFVSLGGRMTRDEAARLQKQARSKGLPRDTFIRNYSD